jgi:hypothetical protein
LNNHWSEYWYDMPEFVNDNNPPFLEINMNFRNEKDMQEFSDLVEQNITNKTIALWYPKLERGKDNSLRYISE